MRVEGIDIRGAHYTELALKTCCWPITPKSPELKMQKHFFVRMW